MKYLYTKMKIFRFKEKLDSLPKRVDNIKPPLHIRLKPTNICNHSCSYCAYRKEGMQLGKDMKIKDSIPEAKMMEIIDDIISMGVKAVTFSGGGDPFCYPYFQQTIEELVTSPVRFASLTNGSRLSGPIAELFAKHGTWLRISIDGWDDESYAKYRNIARGEFSKVLKNMEQFKQLGGNCLLGVSIVVDKENAPHIFEMVSRFKQIGVDSVKISPCIVSNDGAQNNRYHQPLFQTVKPQIQKAKEQLEAPSFLVYDAYHELDEKFDKHYKWCPYIQILPIIGADLNIYSCQDKAYNLDEGLIGSIKDTRFKDFWLTNKEKYFKIDPSKHCNHHCVSNAKNQLVLEYLETDEEHLGFV